MEDFINKIKENDNTDIKVIFDLGNKVFKDKILNDTALKEDMDKVKELLDKINAALDKIKANGEYDKLLKKYFK